MIVRRRSNSGHAGRPSADCVERRHACVPMPRHLLEDLRKVGWLLGVCCASSLEDQSLGGVRNLFEGLCRSFVALWGAVLQPTQVLRAQLVARAELSQRGEREAVIVIEAA